MLPSARSAEIERTARQLAAWHLCIVNDMYGERLPDGVWMQFIPEARELVEMTEDR